MCPRVTRLGWFCSTKEPQGRQYKVILRSLLSSRSSESGALRNMLGAARALLHSSSLLLDDATGAELLFAIKGRKSHLHLWQESGFPLGRKMRWEVRKTGKKAAAGRALCALLCARGARGLAQVPFKWISAANSELVRLEYPHLGGCECCAGTQLHLPAPRGRCRSRPRFPLCKMSPGTWCES